LGHYKIVKLWYFGSMRFRNVKSSTLFLLEGLGLDFN